MNRQERDEWVAALRSGEWKQGHGYMGIDAEGEMQYCCLGVKAELDIAAGRHGISRSGWNTTGDGTVTQCYFLPIASHLSSAVSTMPPLQFAREEWGFTNDMLDTLVKMNDGFVLIGEEIPRHSFHQIAQWIEDNVPVEG